MRCLTASAVALACLVAFAPWASALYLATPLVVSADAQNPSVGDTVNFTITPENETVRAQLAGRQLRISFEWSDGETEGKNGGGAIGNVTLDSDAKGSFTWTVPADTKDQNVHIALHDGDELVGAANVAVENAPPTLMAAQGGMAGGEQPVQNDMGADSPADESADEKARGVPAGGFAILGGAVAVALVLAMRRK